MITTNSGYPLDINLYQAVKGMSCAAQIVKPGGSIIIAAECRDGVPDYGEYRRLVREAGSVQGICEMISQPGFRCQDQWEAQLQARVQQQGRGLCLQLVSLGRGAARDAACSPATTSRRRWPTAAPEARPSARICVLPEGPQTIPYLETV